MEESKVHSKYFVNSKDSIIQDSLMGQCLTNKNLVYYPEYNFIYDKSILETNQVRLVCGGGSGHEPAHSGFVLEGMLTCAVCGDIFSSPSCANIIKAINEIYSDSGVIIIVKNYTGDIINFSLACELFKSQNKKVEMVIVDDDISLTNQNENDDNNKSSFNKRRGLCGTVLLYKILGHLAKNYYLFEEILEFAKNIIPALYTCGVSLTTCIPPFTSVDKNDIMKISEYELGLGIHGEKGKERFEFKSTDEIIKNIFENCFSKNILKKIYDEMNDIVIVVSNLGSATPIEMNVIIKSLCDYLYKNNEKKLNIHKIVYGNLMTSLDMKGFSITIFNLNQNEFLNKYKDKILLSIDEPLNRECGWNVIKNPNDIYNNILKENIKYEKKEEKKLYNDENSQSYIYNLLKDLFNYLLTKRDYLNDLDKKVGDGDIGTGLYNSLTKVLSNLPYLDLDEDFKGSIKKIGEDIGAFFGGTSGPLYMSFLLRASDFLEKNFNDNKINNYLNALKYGTEMIQKVGKAEKGDRTMLDYLLNMCELFEKVDNIEDLKKTFNENNNKILDDVKLLKCKRGRSSYLNGKEIGFDEPGCVLVNTWLDYLLNNKI